MTEMTAQDGRAAGFDEPSEEKQQIWVERVMEERRKDGEVMGGQVGRKAFPRVLEHDHCWGDEPGMTLRQWYAGQALPGLLDRDWPVPISTARRAVEYADALIAELDREA